MRRRMHAFKSIKSIDISTDEGLALADQFREAFELRNTYQNRRSILVKRNITYKLTHTSLPIFRLI